MTDEHQKTLHGSGIATGRYIRTHAETGQRSWVLSDSPCTMGITLFAYGDRIEILQGLWLGDIIAIQKCCEQYLAEESNQKGKP